MKKLLLGLLLFPAISLAQTYGGTGVANPTVHPGAIINIPSATYALNVGDTITPSNAIIRVIGAVGPVILTSTPSIADGVADGETIVIQGTDNTNTVEIQDEGTLANSGVVLTNGKTHITLGEDDSITLVYDLAQDHWQEISSSDITATPIPVFSTYAFSSPSGTSGTFYVAGFYNAPAASVTLTQASPTVSIGSSNVPYEAHAFIVAGGAGTASGGAGTPSIVVSGTSWQDDGTRTPADSQTVVSDITALALNEFAETPKKWIGPATFTLTCSGGCTHTAYSVTINYGLNKYEDFGNRDFTISDFETIGLAGAADTGFNIELVKQASTGWTYSAGAFVPGNSILLNMDTDHSTENDLVNGQVFTYKRAGLSIPINGSGSEGVVIRITTGANNAVRIMNSRLGVLFN